MANKCCEFVDSRLRRCPQASQRHRDSKIEFDSGSGETFNRRRALAYSSRNLS